MCDGERDGCVEGPGVGYEVVGALMVFVSEPGFVCGAVEEEGDDTFDCAWWADIGVSMRGGAYRGRDRDEKREDVPIPSIKRQKRRF